MSYHFLCKRGIRPARTEQFLVDFVIDSFSDTFLSLAEMCLSVFRSSPTDRACCIVFCIQDFGFAACSISLRFSGFLVRSVVA